MEGDNIITTTRKDSPFSQYIWLFIHVPSSSKYDTWDIFAAISLFSHNRLMVQIFFRPAKTPTHFFYGHQYIPDWWFVTPKEHV